MEAELNFVYCPSLKVPGLSEGKFLCSEHSRSKCYILKPKWEKAQCFTSFLKFGIEICNYLETSIIMLSTARFLFQKFYILRTECVYVFLFDKVKYGVISLRSVRRLGFCDGC